MRLRGKLPAVAYDGRDWIAYSRICTEAILSEIEVPGVAAQLLLAAAFLWAALAKVTGIGPLGDTIRRLGTPAVLASVLARALVTLELTTALGLLLLPGWSAPRILVVVLATSFALAGVIARVTRKKVACNCFGTAGGGALGWRQVQLLPVWLGLVAVAERWSPGWTVQDGLGALVVVLLVISAVRVPGHVRTVRALRADRVAMIPTYRSFTPPTEEVRP